MANYEKKIKKNIEKHNEKPPIDPNKKQIRNLLVIFIVVLAVIITILAITYLVQK